jgi:predicted RNase H-like HicB family nuclease
VPTAEEVETMTYSMTCSCGDVMSVQGGTREEAVKNLKAMMNEKTVAEHMKKHPGEEVPSVEQVYAMIEQDLKAAA